MKKIVSLIVCCAIISSICVPAFAAENVSDEPIPDDILESLLENGLVPVSANNVAAMSFEDYCEHAVPAGYVSMGVYEGNSEIEAERIDEGLEFFSFISDNTKNEVLAFLMYLVDIVEFLEDMNDDGVVRAKYYLYMYHRGPSYWYHYVWVYDSNDDGIEEYLACDVKTFYAK